MFELQTTVTDGVGYLLCFFDSFPELSVISIIIDFVMFGKSYVG